MNIKWYMVVLMLAVTTSGSLTYAAHNKAIHKHIKKQTTTRTLNVQKTIGGRGFDAANTIIATNDGNYLVIGRSNSYSQGDMNMNVVKINPSGGVIWNRNYGDSESEEAYTGITTEDGGYMFAGYSDSYGAGPDMKDMWLVKTNSEGKKIWAKTYGTKESIDEAKDIIATEDGGFLLVGNTLPLATAKTDVMIVKIDKSGNVVWKKNFGGTKSDEAKQIAKTENGYVIVGSTESKGKGKWDIWVFSIDKDGKVLWDTTLGGADNEMGNAIAVMKDGSMAIAGYSYTFAEGSHDAWLVKIKKDRTKVWAKNVGGLSTDEAFDIVTTEKNEIVVAGYTDIYEPDEYYNNISPLGNDVLVVKYDEDGNEVWKRSMGGNSAQRALGIVRSGKDGFILAGYTDSANEEKSTDILIIKLDAKGL